MMTEQTEQDFRALWEAVATGRLEVVAEALSSGVDPNVREPNGSTPLIVAAMFGQTSMVSLMIEKKARLDIQNNEGSTA